MLIGALLWALPAAAENPPAGVSATEWDGIQEQIESERHSITKSDRTGRLFQADNPAQRFTAHFGAEDVMIAPRGRDEPAWKLGLRLTAWGAAHDLKQVNFASTSTEGNRIEYRRGALTEWYVNTAIGLEQGFTIEAPPGDGITELILEMTIDTTLIAELAGSGQSVAFRHENSNTALTYSGLKAWDAVEQPLEARMELAGGGTRLRLVVGVEGAAWPVTVDPIFKQCAKLLPTVAVDTQDAHFGRSLAIDGDVMVVSLDDRDDGYWSGSAFIFQRDQGGPDSWGQVTKITPDVGEELDGFGWSVAVSGNIAVIGAPGDDDHGSGSGSAYIFRRNQGGPDVWGQVTKVLPIDGAEGDHFGTSVYISGDTAIVGSCLDDDNGSDSGSAYIFQQDLGGAHAWGLAAKITPNDGQEGDRFGCDVSISGDTAIVGAGEDDDNGDRSGSAYIFRRHQGGTDAWGQVAKLVPSDGGQLHLFGESVAVYGSTAIVGAHNDVVNGSSTGWGSAYIFRRDQGGADSWGQVEKITPTDGSDDDHFGGTVAIDANTSVIGAVLSDSLGLDSGAAYVFTISDAFFADGFEIGDTSAWSRTEP